MTNSIEPIYGPQALLLTCIILICGFAVIIGFIWLFIACVVDAYRKDETVFKDRQLWLVILIAGFFFGMAPIVSILYYILFKPKLKYW